MSKLIYGDRIGKTAVLSVGAAAIILIDDQKKVLLTRRSDNGRWCLPGGGMDPGESAEETCVRETLEEVGLKVRITRLIGIYTNPNVIVEYEDENRRQPVDMTFEAEVIDGELSLTDEITDYGYFSVDSLNGLDIVELDFERIQDAALKLPHAIMK